MDTQRLILFFVFVFSTFMLLEGWQRDQKQQAPVTQGAGKANGKADGKSEPGAIPVPAAPVANVPAVSGSGTPGPAAAIASGGETIKVETDVLLAHISTQGGDIRYLELKQHKGTLDKSKNFVLFQKTADNTYIAQSGLTAPVGQGPLPNHNTIYTASSRAYKLADGAQGVEVRLEAPPADGVTVAQVYKFARGSYVIDLTYEITNGADKALQPHGYFQLVRDRKPPDGDSAMLPTYTGLAVYTKGEKFQKVAFDDVDKGKTPYSKTSQDEGWIAVIQHYFLSAFLPKDKTRGDTGGAEGTNQHAALRGSARYAYTGNAGTGSRPGGGFRHTHRNRQAAVRVADVDTIDGGQLGHRHHSADGIDQGAVLPVAGRQL